MTSEPDSDSPLELAHVLFTDIVGYSKLLGNPQREVFQRLNEIVCGARAERRGDVEIRVSLVSTVATATRKLVSRALGVDSHVS